MISGSLLMVSRFFALTNTCQVFHNNNFGINRFSKGDQLLAGNVTKLLRYGFLSSAQPFEKATSRRGANAGNLCFSPAKTKTTMVKDTSRDIQSFAGLPINRSQ